MVAQIDPWVITTPFGLPVVPDVYMMVEMSVALGGSGSTIAPFPRLYACSQLIHFVSNLL